MAQTSALEDQFLSIWLSCGGPKLERQTMLKDVVPEWPGRHSLDFYCRSEKMAIEINGGTFCRSKKGHNTGVGLRRDYTKALVLQLAGIKCISLDTTQARSRPFVNGLINRIKGKDVVGLGFYQIAWNLSKAPTRKKKRKK